MNRFPQRASRRLRLACALAILLPHLPAWAENTPNLLINPGADTGNLSGWTINLGAPHADSGTFNPSILPQSGPSDFVGGSTPTAALYQIVPISGLAVPYELIDAGLVTANFSWFQQSLAQSPTDTSGVSYSFHDAASAFITSAIFPQTAGTGSWASQSHAVAAPATSRSIIYQLDFTRKNGNDIDAYIDTNSLILSYNGSAWNSSANDHLWNNPANWNSAVPAPAAAAVLTRASGSDSVTFNGNYATPLSYLFIDAPSGMTLNQSANAMNATNQYIGNAGTGIYNQSGGANNAQQLVIGAAAGALGTYNQSAGLNTTQDLFIGSPVGSSGLYSLTGGTLTSLGDVFMGSGTLAIAGGSASLHSGLIGANARLIVSSGTLVYGSIKIPNSASFNWTGGAITFPSTIFAGNQFPATLTLGTSQSAAFTGTGTFSFNAVSGANAALILGFSTVTAFNQNGPSSVTVGTPLNPRNLYLTPISGRSADYTLSDPAASLVVNGLAYVGGADNGSSGGTSSFTISAGVASISFLFVQAGGTVSLGGGTLTTGFLALPMNPVGFSWTGGMLNITTANFILDSGQPSYAPALTLNGSQSATFTGDGGVGISGVQASNVALFVGQSGAGSLIQNGTGAIIVGTPATPRNLEIASAISIVPSTYTLSNPATSLLVNGNVYLGGFDGGSTIHGGNFNLSAGSVTVTGTFKFWNPSSFNFSGGFLALSIFDASANPSGFHWTGGNLSLLSGTIIGLTSLTVPASSTLSGSGIVFAPITLNGAITLAPPSDDLALHGTTAGPGTITVGINTSLTSDSLQVNALAISGIVHIRPNSHSTSRINIFTLAGSPNNWTARLDLADSRLIVQTFSPLDKVGKIASLANQITSASNDGTWTGNGITSSTVALNPQHYSLGLFDNATLALATFGGLPVDPNSLLVFITHSGDANLSGIIDIQDQSIITNNWQTPKSNWAAGDLNLDGFVDIQDLTLVTNNWQQQSTFSLTPDPQPLTPSSVPEPLTLPLLALPLLVHRRKP